ncbi:hypothetical protein PR202_gb25548 [Eleusine coracana subsp. coracana]|uniref:Uncharacterized protein n=1 Tax=Eleusine coracana subsp. coracana TaxID=191504 RepID=A0AAV5FPJ3_ELECO|nr:hypothetical protein PR202_gb25548 [Eleusine coracana subsp. coracana]
MGRHIKSGIFKVGGFNWAICYYTDGSSLASQGYVGVALELMSPSSGVRATFDIGLVNHRTGLSQVIVNVGEPQLYSNALTRSLFGFYPLMKTSELEVSEFLQDDCLIIQCDLRVIGMPQIEMGTEKIQVPPPDIVQNLQKLLEQKEATDVSFDVQGVTFDAHKIILAMRSPVFKAELYGSMMETRMHLITIEDMQPVVFKALLHFIYTDSLHLPNDLDGEEKIEMVKHLLVAADRYAMERLKLICEYFFSKKLAVENVAAIFHFADQYNSHKLKDACVEFMTTSNRINDVALSQGYSNLKRDYPCVLVEMLEKASKIPKI